MIWDFWQKTWSAPHVTPDRIIYQDLADLKAAVSKANPAISSFDASCFDGHYITSDITTDYLNRIEARRNNGKVSDGINQLALDFDEDE